MRFDLTGKVALVTGASRGIGRGIARMFADSGAKVAVCARSEAQGQESVREIEQAGGIARLILADVSTKAACVETIAQTVAAFGDLDIVVHNAAYVPFATLDAISDEDMVRTIDTNLMAAIWLTQASRPHLIDKQAAGGGRLIFVGALAGLRTGTPALSHYGASKAGLVGFASGAAAELAPHGVTVNVVEPGITRGSTFETASEAQVAAIAANIPLGRIGEPEDIALACLFFALPQASAITAQYLSVDNGSSMCAKPWKRPWEV
jgi:3-oxoacyl-[acyl-carrier protein] reductase